MFSKKFTFGLSIILFTSLSIYSANAESKWNPISSSDYIFGFTSFKYACWAGSFNNDSAPVLQVYENGKWLDASKGQMLPAGSDISTPCDSTYPVAVGYQWTVMNPAPPIGLTGSSRYSILYRQKMPDIVTKEAVQVTKSVPELVTKYRLISKQVPQLVTSTRVVTKSVPILTTFTRTVLKTVKKPYIVTVIKNGKKTQEIKYKSVIIKVPETYTENVWVDRAVFETYTETVMVDSTEIETYTETVIVEQTVTEYKDKVTLGYISSNDNVLVYPSVSAMNQAYTDIANGILCALGLSTNCRK